MLERLFIKKVKIKKVLIVFLVLFLLIAPSLALAQTKITFENPLKIQGDNPIAALIGGFIGKAVMGIIGSIGLIMLVVGGLVWLTAAGNEERVTKAKQIIIWTLLGMVMIFGSYTIVSALFAGFEEAGVGAGS